ncbi:uncharacterized protein LOC135217728 isoform X3 [Macrobrachium nipponense]|uniref:uncharacterized protein LOC135217728 isoform X3 n=1 Tax=Macrobrachium nipponense TaxID=159736 RepID=UPI0030C8AE7E
MGVLYQDAERPSKSKMEGSDSFYVQGQQIMSVNTFVREIESLRIHREAEGPLIRHTDNKIFASHMLPVVLVEIDTPSVIRRKIAALKKGSLTVRNRIVSSSESEEEVDGHKLPVVSSSRTLTSAPPVASSHISNHSDGPDSETNFSEDDFLPDLSDPSYDIHKRSTPKKTKLLKGHPDKKSDYIKKRLKTTKIFKGSDGKLMKAAKQNCLAKQKMFAISPKDKRVFKSGQENDKTALTGEQQKDNKIHEYKAKPSFSTAHHFKTTGIAELKPFAKSPKDVERKLTTSIDLRHVSDLQEKNRGNNKEEAVEKRSQLRILLQKRLESPPPVSPLKSCESPKDPEPEIESLSGEMNVSQETSNCNYDSDDTIIFEEDSPGDSGTKKRKNSDDKDDNKKLKTAAESSHGLRIVPSPIPFIEQSSYNREADGEQQIKIQQVEGGVTDAFESSDPSSNPEIKKLKLLKVKMEMKTALEKRLSTAKKIHEENLRKEKAAYERRIRAEERRYQSEVTVIENKKQKLDVEINSILVYGEENIESGTADASPTLSVVLAVPHEDSSQPEVKPAEGLEARLSKAKLNIIPDACVSRFGTLPNLVPATSCTVGSGVPPLQVGNTAPGYNNVNVEEPHPKPKRGRPRKIKPVPMLDVMSLPPAQSVGPVTAPSQPVMFKQKTVQPCPNVVVSSDGAIHNKSYDTVRSPQKQIHPKLSNSTVLPSPALFSHDIKTSVSSTTSPILVQISPAFQSPNTPQIHLPPQFQTPNSGVLFVSSQGGIPVSGPVIVNAMSPAITDSQRISFTEKPASVAQSLSSSTPLLSIPSTTQLSSASQTSAYVSTGMGGATRLTQHQKSHLLVAAQPAITSGSATQAKPLPSNSSVITSHPVTKTGAVYGETSKRLTLSKADHFSPNEEERSSSPEAEQSCFLCGSPGEFVCCNSIVYCSADCKSKDWGRHSGECAHSSSKYYQQKGSP